MYPSFMHLCALYVQPIPFSQVTSLQYIWASSVVVKALSYKLEGRGFDTR
jgi:hypothetical protein